MIVALLLTPFHAHAYVGIDGTVAAVVLEADGSGSGEPLAPGEGEGGCPVCWLSKKLQMPLRDPSSTGSLRGLTVLTYPPGEADMGPQFALFGVFRPPSIAII